MRECFVNVYPCAPEHRQVGPHHEARSDAERACRNRREEVAVDEHPAFRIHVRLKPEGAPRRYASRWERAMWENDAAGMRQRIRERQEAERRRRREDEERFIFAG